MRLAIVYMYIVLFTAMKFPPWKKAMTGSLEVGVAVSGVKTLRKRQSSLSVLGQRMLGVGNMQFCGQPGGSVVHWRMPGHGNGGLIGYQKSGIHTMVPSTTKKCTYLYNLVR